ncbi:MAG TPA: hypothetical protein VL096_02145 [Pirellulaceae bacterium]|nr:hypothetical protein [Pirellulaceae bacterium]
MFIAVGHNGLRLTSADGTSWSVAQLGKEGELFRAVAYGANRFVAVGSYGGDNITAFSTNGTTWQQGKIEAKYSKYIRGLGYGHEQFLGLGGDPGSVGDSKPFVVTSGDGDKWSDFQPVPGKHILRRIAWGNERFVAVGDRGRRATSRDGITWEDAAETKALDTLVDIAFGNGLFVGVGLHGLRMSSDDGLRWSPAARGNEGEHLNAILWTGERFVAIGAGQTYHSADGRNWEHAANKLAPTTAAYGHGRYVGALWKGKIVTSTDGLVWTEAYKSEHHIEALAFGKLAS